MYHHSMMMNIENVKPGTDFSYLGFSYRLVRQTGQVIDAPNFNRWGRRVGGTHKAHRIVVQSLTGRSRPRYVAYPVGTRVIVD